MTDPFQDIPSSETVFGIPQRHWHCHLHNFDWSVVSRGSDKARTVSSFITDHLDGTQRNLILVGVPGTGKTHIAVGLYRAAVAARDLTQAVFLHVPTVSQQVKARFDDMNVPDPMEKLNTARLVVLDDPFGREPTDWERAQIIPRLIDTAYQRNASVVVTANDRPATIRNQIDAHEWSRLQENAVMLEFFEDDDYRKRRGG